MRSLSWLAVATLLTGLIFIKIHQVSASQSKLLTNAIIIQLTATPSPTDQNPWIKLKNTSFQTRNSISSQVPFDSKPFSIDDIDDTPVVNLFDSEEVGSDIVNAGVISTSSIVQPLLGLLSYPQWVADQYTDFDIKFNDPQSYLNYMRARRPGFAELDSANPDMSWVNTDGVYHYKGPEPLKLNHAPLNGHFNFVVISDQPVIIGGTIGGPLESDFNTSADGNFPQHSLAIIAPAITFRDYLQKAYGIFITNKVDLGYNPNLGLKIKGNLIVRTGNLFSELSRGRVSENNLPPALYIVNYPKMYLELLPYLSISVYDWKEEAVERKAPPVPPL